MSRPTDCVEKNLKIVTDTGLKWKTLSSKWSELYNKKNQFTGKKTMSFV